MESRSDLIGKVEEEIQWYEKMLCDVKDSLAGAPEGSLRIAKNHGSTQYYRRLLPNDTKGEYISKRKNRELVRELAQKGYDRKILGMLEDNKKLLQIVKRDYHPEKLLEVYDLLSDTRKELVTPRILSDKEFARQWEDERYEGKGNLSDTPEIYTEKGERVRSKSEKMIADKLFMMGIPYRYEHPLVLKGFGKIYPDFTLLDVAGRKEWILEHFGMMDQEAYCEKAVKKIHFYMKNGIFPGDRLLLTYETSHTPIDMRLVQKLLERFVWKMSDD